MKHEHHESDEHHETYKTRSIEEIIRVGKQLLEDDEIAFIDEVRLGRWVMASDRGIYGVYDSKHQAIEDTISGHSQTRDNCKVKRYRKGVYEVEVLDIDEDPCEKYYHGYILEKITPENLAEYRDMAFTGVAPDELFDVYSDLFKIFEKFEYGEITEEEILSQLKEIGYT